MADSKEYKRLWAKAIQALARREHSVKELSNKLLGRTEQPQLVHELISSLIEDDYLSDDRFTEMLCRSRFNKGSGPLKLKHELNQHDIDVSLIETYLSLYDNKWIDRLVEIRTKKYGEEKPSDYKEWSRQARFLQQRGFSTEQVRIALEQ